MANDIRPFGAGEGVGFYWVQAGGNPGAPYLTLVAIDELGKVISTGLNSREWDPAAATRAEAVYEHLSSAIGQADANLERRRQRQAEEPAEPQPEPIDPPTQRFFADGE